MRVPGYVGICVACFEPIKEGELFRLRENGRNFHKDCAMDYDNCYVRLEAMAGFKAENGRKESQNYEKPKPMESNIHSN